MSIENFLLTSDLGMVLLMGVMFIPFGLVFASVAHGWRLKLSVDEDCRHRMRLARDYEARVLAELTQSK